MRADRRAADRQLLLPGEEVRPVDVAVEVRVAIVLLRAGGDAEV